jgi:hypothetical protein
MDADDWSFPYRFEKQINFLENNSEVGIVGGAIEVVNEDLSNVLFIRKYFENDFHLKKYWFRQSPFAHPCIMFRKEIVEDHTYNKKLSPTEDYDYYFRVGKKAKFANLEDIIVKYRIYPTQSSSIKAKRQQLLTLYIRLKAFVEYGYIPNTFDVLFSLLQLGSIILLPQKVKFFLFNLVRKK